MDGTIMSGVFSLRELGELEFSTAMENRTMYSERFRSNARFRELPRRESELFDIVVNWLASERRVLLQSRRGEVRACIACMTAYDGRRLLKRMANGLLDPEERHQILVAYGEPSDQPSLDAMDRTVAYLEEISAEIADCEDDRLLIIAAGDDWP